MVDGERQGATIPHDRFRGFSCGCDECYTRYERRLSLRKAEEASLARAITYFPVTPNPDTDETPAQEHEMTKKLDHSKPMQTRDGKWKASFLTQTCNANCNKIYHFVLENERMSYVASRVTDDGRFIYNGPDSVHDIVNVPEVTCWFSIVFDSGYIGATYSTLKRALDDNHNSARSVGHIIKTFSDCKLLDIKFIKKEEQ